jgi:hypothetical protein
VSYGFSTRIDGTSQAARVGTNGSGDVMLALWLAAYGATGRPDSRRVRARWYSPVRGAPVEVWSANESIRQARTVIATNLDDCAWIIVNDRTDATIERGIKLKPPTDPPLVALVDYWRHYQRLWDRDSDSALGVDLTRRLAETFTLLLPELKPSCWYSVLAEVTDLFVKAAAAGVSVSHG